MTGIFRMTGDIQNDGDIQDDEKTPSFRRSLNTESHETSTTRLRF